MARVINASPMDMRASVYGHVYVLPGEKITVIKELVLAYGETHGSEDVARKLVDQLGVRGLRFLDEDDPMPQAEHARLSRKQFVKFGRAQIKAFNDLNLKQASESLATMLPDDTLLEIMAAVKKVEAEDGKIEGWDPEFVSQDELHSIQRRESQNAAAKLQAVEAAVQTGDLNAVRAALGQGRVLEAGHTEPAEGQDAGETDPTRDLIEPKHAGRGPGRAATRIRQTAATAARTLSGG